MYSCLTRVVATNIKRFNKVAVFPLSNKSFDYNDYKIQADELIHKLTLEVQKAWKNLDSSYSENDLMAAGLIIDELTTNAIKSSLQRLQKQTELKKNSSEALVDEIHDPKVTIRLRIFKTGVEIVVEDYGLGLPKDLKSVPREDSKVVCNFVCGGRGLNLILKLSQILKVSYRNKDAGFRTNNFDPEKINGSIVTAWRFVLAEQN